MLRVQKSDERHDFERKYETSNPLSRVLVNRFTSKVLELANSTSPHTILDVGCGEGHLTKLLFDTDATREITGIDVRPDALEKARSLAKNASFYKADIYELPFDSKSIDLVVATEVLEHLERPEVALSELKRVTRSHCLLTVPNEPLWRFLNLARGAYVKELGNTPGHLQHWSTGSFRKFLGQTLQIVQTETPLPWTACLCRK